MNNDLNNTNRSIHRPGACSTAQEWKNAMVEAALGGATEARLQEHLQTCESCCQELEGLRARAARIDAALPLVARAEPQPDFHERVMQATEAAQESHSVWREWLRLPQTRWVRTASAFAAAMALVMLVITQLPRRDLPPPDAIAAATQLAHWQAPTDVLLQTPGDELLRDMPRLDGSFFEVHLTATEESHK